jgi:predicted glycosyltransferase
MPISNIDAQTDAGHELAASDGDASAPRRVLFYSHDGTGLGHLRITLGVATAYANRRPQDSLLLLTGSAHAGSYALPSNLDYVKIPAMPKRDLYASLPPTEGYTGSHNSTIRFRTALARSTVEAFDPHLVVVDHAPAGLFREFVPSLEWLKARGRATLALLMRDITFSAEQTREIWTNERVYPLLDGHYDQILIYGDRQVFDPIEAYAMPEGAAARARFCGYLAPLPPRRSPTEARAAVGADSLPLVVVSVGGGADGAPLLRAYLQGLRERTGPPVHSYVVTGPLLPEPDREEILALAREMLNVRIVEFDPDFAAVLQAADAVVSMGGYNSLAEAVYFGKRPVVVPRMPGPLEQVLRAEGFARLGHAVAIEPMALTPTMLWNAIDSELRGGQEAARALPFDGLQQIALALAETFEDRESRAGALHRGDCGSN